MESNRSLLASPSYERNRCKAIVQDHECENNTRYDLWDPILDIELRRTFTPNKSAAGPDGITVRELKQIPVSVLHRFFNIFTVCGSLPDFLLRSRTIFLDKKEDSTNPADLNRSALKRSDEFRYLGVPINAAGGLNNNVRSIVREKLGKLTAVPLKPLQRNGTGSCKCPYPHPKTNKSRTVKL
ncbi:hypothetical protein GWI33_012591 [Rhynchophorus ferrugineus]|uniref:Uncharacterized protein n=1 Tax=Rhynchophorus ferrugineus TaxID=354439 RepID=A0A834IIF2_RHYFE|nr:hypothetical protein GWI33_012591 [Rhynchophorus ferrugineus]